MVDSQTSSDKNMQVFTAISELMTDSQFITANQEFFQKHCEVFDADVEENKFEYMHIFEEFLKIQEDVIEGKLKEQFTEDQVLQFYESLKDQIKTYEAKDKETVDFLYEMIDFNKFKARMCTAKAMHLQDQKQAAQKLENAEMLKSRDSFDLLAEKAQFQKLMGESVTDVANGWKKRLEQKVWKNDVTIAIYSKKQKTSKNDIFRIHAKYRNAKLEDVVEIDKNLPVEKFDFIKEEQKIDVRESDDKNDWSCIRLQVTTAPMVTDREVLSLVSLTKDTSTGQYFYCTRSIDDARFPEGKNRIRIYQNESFMLREEMEDGVPVTVAEGFSLMDLKGYIPASLLNMTAANNIFKFQQAFMKVLRGQ